MEKQRHYITTPIYYVNDRPHIGHAYTTIAADIFARYEREKGNTVTFLTGTDENSQKTVDAAEKLGEEVKAYTDRLAEIWKATWQKLGISNTDFIRTTEPRHIETVKEFWHRVDAAGDIYKGKYVGLYCKGHEAFLKESDLVDGLCPDHKTAPEKIEEENYFFRLSKYQKQLLEIYEHNSNFVTPESRFYEVRAFVAEGLEDISISRATPEWGIPVPTDPKHVVYVWFDALINYMSAVGMEGWRQHPADAHFIGKDIVRFHAVIWPAMLMSAGFPLPKQVVTNGFFTSEGVKISKSLGNAIDPLALAEKYGNDALRYYLFREISFGNDGDFSEKKFIERYNGELANGLGNLVARVAALGEGLSPLNATGNLPEALKNARSEYDKAMKTFRFNEALAIVWKYVAEADLKLSQREPWKIKDEATKRTVLAELALDIAVITALLEPFLPGTVEKIKQQISFDRQSKAWHIKKGEALFPRLETS